MPIFLPGPIHGFGYGGDTYGYSPYGAAALVRPPVPTTGGYGGAAYGYSSYGSVDVTPPRVVSVNSLDGFRVEVLFSEVMDPASGLLDPTSYSFAVVHGAPVTATSVASGTASGLGFTSVIVGHTGTTLGGQYVLTVSGPTDIAGNPIGPPPTDSAAFSALGDEATIKVGVPFGTTADDGRTVVVIFMRSDGLEPQDILTEAEFSPGVDSSASYEVTTAYPVVPAVTAATQSANLSMVTLDVHPMTSTEYNLVVGPSEAFAYQGSVLPSADPNLTAVETGVGSSSASAAGLLLAKAAGVAYGWYLGDDTGRVVSGSTFRVDFEFDASGATISPPMFGTSLAALSVCDGGVQVDIVLSDVAGTKVIDVVSGAYTAQVPAAWDGALHTVSLVRNIMGTFYSVLFDGVPLLTFPAASATGAPTFPAGALTGASVILSGAHAVSLFKLVGVEVTASSTVFTSAWNFIHGASSLFTGSSVLTNDRLLTDRGPLVRGWGDASPAEKGDVAVRLNGTGVEVASVNPYHGVIFPTIPIPLSAPGIVTVETDYTWFANPPMEFAGLNTRGLTLNKWDRATGHTAGAASPVPAGSEGAPRTGRFPMGLLLAPMSRPSPLKIGHRYYGYQRDYSALLNEPTSLLLNIDPHSVSVGGVSASSIRETGYFYGNGSPTESVTPWMLVGSDGGSALGNGVYRVIDTSSGPYGVGTAAIYEREADLALPTSCTMIARMQAGSYTLDGVFTGIGFGVHDGNHLVLIGLIVVDGVRHLGLLKNAEEAHVEAGWELGPKAAALGVSTTQITVPYEVLPTGLNRAPGAGTVLDWSLIRIPVGVQAGVYRIASCGMFLNEDGLVEITLADSTPLPVDPATFGAAEFDVLFDVPWDEAVSSYRLLSSFPDGSAELYVGGALSGFVVSSDEVAPYPADTALLFSEGNEGVFFWGSVSRRAKSVSDWDIVQYASDPERLTDTVQGISVFTEMGTVPQDDPNDQWFISGGFGYSEVDDAGDRILLKSTSGALLGSPDLEFGYSRIEPYLTPAVTTDIEGTFLIESASFGAGAAQIQINDTVRTARVVSLRIARGGDTSFPNRILTLPYVSVSGLMDPVSEGWTISDINTLAISPRGQILFMDATATQAGYWRSELPLAMVVPGTAMWEGAIAEARIAVTSYTQGASDYIGPYVSASNRVGLSAVSREVATALSVVGGVPGVHLVDSSQNQIVFFPFDWTDGEPHTYRTLIDPVADIVVLVIDDDVQGDVAFTDFAQDATTTNDIRFGISGDAEVSTEWHSVSAEPLRPIDPAPDYSVTRTFGVWLGGDPDAINSYAIPREDTTGEPNTSFDATFVEMDWRVACRVRLYLDPSWGVGLYRPDLPLPPTATEDFVTETTDPTAAWVNVEYRALPAHASDRGDVSFGAIDPRGITQQRWDSVRYRIRGVPTGFGMTPQGMVLNRATPLTSGEFLYDVTPEVVTVRSLNAHAVSVWSSNMIADRVFVVEVDGSVVPSDRWRFEESTQTVILDDSLPAEHHPVTITFAPGRPVTRTYLCSQPISGSVTVLNEGTPPVPFSRDSAATRDVVSGSVLNDPWDVLDDPDTLITNDPKRTVRFSLGEDALYADLDGCEVEDGESVHITTLCDAPGPGTGFSAMGLDGHLTANEFSLPEGPAGTWGKQSPSIKGSATHFDPAVTLLASGGVVIGGTLGPGSAILHQNQRGPSLLPPEGGFGINQDFGMALTDVTVREDVMDLPTAASDDTAPSGASPVNGYGVADGVLADYAAVASHLGPAGGLTGLTLSDSLLAGGAQLNGSEFILVGGAQLPRPTDTVIVFENPLP